MGRLEDQVALVTGGGRGIGRGICLALAAEGATVVVADLDMTTANQTAGELENAGRKALGVASRESAEAAVERAADRVWRSGHPGKQRRSPWRTFRQGRDAGRLGPGAGCEPEGHLDHDSGGPASVQGTRRREDREHRIDCGKARHRSASPLQRLQSAPLHPSWSNEIQADYSGSPDERIGNVASHLRGPPMAHWRDAVAVLHSNYQHGEYDFETLQAYPFSHAYFR